MKRILLYIVIIVVVFAVPLSRADVGRLEPVQTVAIYMLGDDYVVETDTLGWGIGRSLEEAIADLKASAPAIVYLDTADYLLLQPGILEEAETLKSVLKGSISVYFFEGDPELQAVSKFLNIHDEKVYLKNWKNGVVLPVLTTKNGRMVLT